MSQEFIKIPTDFKSLHDLKELMENYAFVTKLANALNSYQETYIESYLMTMDEVLAYIPQDQHEKYTLRYRKIAYCDLYNGNIRDYDKKHREIEAIKKLPLHKELLIVQTKNVKMFLVNTIDKKIDICFWAKGSKHILGVVCGVKYEGLEYSKKVKFVVDDKKNKLFAYVDYTRTETQAVGGVWINGRERGYLAHHTYVPYTLGGQDIYSFCTRTNKYLGYKGCEEEPQRGWQEI